MKKTNNYMNQSVETKIELALDQLKRVREDIKSVDTKFEKFEKKIDDQYPTRREIAEIETRVGKLEGNWVWLIRVVGGALIVSALGIFFAFKQ